MNRKVLKYVILSTAVSCLSLITLSPFFDRFENQIYDLRFRQKYFGVTEEGSLGSVVIADIDTRSVEKLGKYFDWPRTYFAKTVDALSNSGSALTCFDILFDKSALTQNDSVFKASLSGAGNVITGYNFEYEDRENFIYADSTGSKLFNAIPITSAAEFVTDEFPVMNAGDGTILNSSLANGYLGMDSDEDGVIRKVHLVKKYQGAYYPSFAFVTVLKLLNAAPESIILKNGESIEFNTGMGEKLTIPVDENNYMYISYKGPWRSFKTISIYDIMERRVGKKTFRDKPVIIGSSLRGLMDLRSTPVQKHYPGVEVHASIINTILTGDYITKTGTASVLLVMLFMIVFTSSVIFSRLNIILSTIAVFATGFIYYKLTGRMFFDNNQVLDTTRPLLALFFTFLTSYTIRYYIENRSKKFIKATLGKYVPEIVSKELLKNPEKFKLGGEKKEITMMFSDIRSFTSYSEKTDPKQLVEFLNIYLKRMTGVIKKNCGTLDKYMGDAVICFFGAPVDNDHPYNSCKSALEMMNELKLLKSELKEDTFKNIDIGIGVNTDIVTVGNIGSDDLFDYTAIGDGMNLASRLEGLNKYYGTHILVSGNTYEQVKEKFIFRELDEVSVKGKDRSVKIFELIGKTGEEPDEKVKIILEKYGSALEMYKAGDFSSAGMVFNELSEKYSDRSSALMAERCRTMEISPVDNWKGVWKMDSK
ncbi:MAG: adenylate/guanylate cyclase domain-containing protein [Candidatus Delongbacteria bacterium]|nr:adenylate/guanylate cyclase domain-containing protein [Candidatus Delongbacteria bacterium]